MKHTEEQMLEKAKKVLKDIQRTSYREENILGVSFRENKEVARPREKKINSWTTSLHEPVFDRALFLVLSDETGEPLYFQSPHKVGEIEKDSQGNYFRKEN
jgi:hypothetical protein